MSDRFFEGVPTIEGGVAVLSSADCGGCGQLLMAAVSVARGWCERCVLAEAPAGQCRDCGAPPADGGRRCRRCHAAAVAATYSGGVW